MKKLIAQTSAILGVTLFLFVGCSKKSEKKQYVVGEDFDEEAFIASESNERYDFTVPDGVNFVEPEFNDEEIFASAEVPDISLFKYELNGTGDGLIITEYNGTEISNLKIPNEIEGFPVVQINCSLESSSNQAAKIKTVVFPDSAKSISIPYSVENVHLPASLESIPSRLFFECKNLKKITIPKGVKKIGEGAFFGSGITSLTIPDSVEELEKGAFSGAYYLQNIKLPSNLKTLSESLFFKCLSLKSVDISEGITEIPGRTFGGCVSLETINFPSSLKTIGSLAFSGCISLKNLSLPDGLETIDNAFNYDYDWEFENVEKAIIENLIDANISDIEKQVIGLVSLEIPDSVTNLNCTFQYLSKLEYLKLPNTLKDIEAELLHIYKGSEVTELRNLKTIALPSSCEKIGLNAFSNLTSLEKIEIPESITQLEFSGDYGLFKNTNLNLATQARLRQLGYKGRF